MSFLNIFKHLLPTGRAWSITVDKRLRQFFQGLSDSLISPMKLFVDQIWQDIFPQTTRELDQWEDQFSLTKNATLTEQERRDRLEATWRAVGGQSPFYIQNTLRDAGFDVYIHEWWEEVVDVNNIAVCGLETSVCDFSTAVCSDKVIGNAILLRNPFSVLGNVFPAPAVDCGEDFAECGEPDAECGNTFLQTGYLLVNKNDNTQYLVPNDADKWRYILYIGGVNFGDIAQVPLNRRNEFEALCLKICPAQQWLGLIVEYV